MARSWQESSGLERGFLSLLFRCADGWADGLKKVALVGKEIGLGLLVEVAENLVALFKELIDLGFLCVLSADAGAEGSPKHEHE